MCLVSDICRKSYEAIYQKKSVKVQICKIGNNDMKNPFISEKIGILVAYDNNTQNDCTYFQYADVGFI